MQTYLKQCRHGQFILLRGDMISQHADMYGEWAEAEVQLFRSLLPEDGVCIEVGSNIGLHAVPLSGFCPQGKLFCYEPQRPIFHLLCGNLALNNRLNVVAQRLAVSEAPGILELQTSDYEAAWNYGSFSIVEGFSTEDAFQGPVDVDPVEIVTLDGDPALANLTRLDLLKIDAEGLEPSVLIGAAGLIAQFQPDIFVEVLGLEQANSILAELGDDYVPYFFFAARFRPGNFNRLGVKISGHDTNLILRHRSRDQGVLATHLICATGKLDGTTPVPVFTDFPPAA